MATSFTDRQNNKWLARLPKKFVTVKAIVTSTNGNVLLVKPIYKETWQLPGGGVEPFEEPKEALLREFFEEVGLTMQPDDFKLVGTVFRKEYDNLVLVYECVKQLHEEIELTLQANEIEDFTFENPTTVVVRLGNYYNDFWTIYVQK